MAASDIHAPNLKYLRKCFNNAEVTSPIAHGDGNLNKTNNASLVKVLENMQKHVLVEPNFPFVDVIILNSGCLLQKTILQHNKSCYRVIARELLVKVCCAQSNESHLLLENIPFHSLKILKKGCDEPLLQVPLCLISLALIKRSVAPGHSRKLLEDELSRKNFLVLYYKNGKIPNMGQSLEEKFCMFLVEETACFSETTTMMF